MTLSDKVTIYTISVPEDTEWNSQHAIQFIQQLLVINSRLDLVIEATHREITWQIHDWTNIGYEALENVIRSNFYNSEVVVEEVMAGNLKSHTIG